MAKIKAGSRQWPARLSGHPAQAAPAALFGVLFLYLGTIHYILSCKCVPTINNVRPGVLFQIGQTMFSVTNGIGNENRAVF